MNENGLIIYCDVCGHLITTPGALLFSPPEGNMVMKTHICIDCNIKIEHFISEITDY